MKFYEIMYIVHPILEMGRLYDLILETEDKIKVKGGNTLFTKVMGKKRMAYPIQNQKFGTYILVQFKSIGSKNNEFSLELEHNPNILRHMIINIEESEIKEQSEEIKEQIAGLSRGVKGKNSEDKSEPSENVLEDKKSPINENTKEIKTEEKEVEEDKMKLGEDSSTIVDDDTTSEANKEKEK